MTMKHLLRRIVLRVCYSTVARFFTYIFYVSVLRSARFPQFRPTRRLLLKVSKPESQTISNPTLLTNDQDLNLIAKSISSSGDRDLCFIYLDHNLSTAVASPQPLNVGSDIAWKADPRSFNFRGDAYISYNSGHSEFPNNIYVQGLTRDGLPMGQSYKVIKDDRRPIEKNWLFFEYDSQLFCIYQFSPFIVLRCEIDHQKRHIYCRPYSEHNVSIPTDVYGEIRGGAGPIILNNALLGLYQCHSKSLLGKDYRSGPFTFTHRDGSFRLDSLAKEPFLTLSLKEYLQIQYPPFNPTVNSVFYPCGMHLSGDDIIISYGVNDCRVGLMSFPQIELLSRLSPCISI